jgi:sorbitol-specific phosphotransferase system component IIA
MLDVSKQRAAQKVTSLRGSFAAECPVCATRVSSLNRRSSRSGAAAGGASVVVDPRPIAVADMGSGQKVEVYELGGHNMVFLGDKTGANEDGIAHVTSAVSVDCNNGCCDPDWLSAPSDMCWQGYDHDWLFFIISTAIKR